MSTVAIFGGSFNPPHLAHQMLCLSVLETAAVDELWMVPTYRHPFAKHLVPFEHRFRMCELAVEVFAGRVQVSRIEEELGQPSSRTLDTLQALRAQHPETELRLVVGADILAERDKWYRWDEIERLAPSIVVGRQGYESDAAIELPNVSSTAIRERLARGQSAIPMVPRSVMRYIEEHSLYR
jgi:nicotinate-nucleotide adenylyltransferase